MPAHPPGAAAARPAMAWQGTLDLRYRIDLATGTPRCVVSDRHDGPSRVLAALYPEGPAVCHSVIVHPPGGVAGGDRLDLHLTLGARTHALITTPGATRFYRSAGDGAVQAVHASVADDARLEWLPLETLVYPAAMAESRAVFELSPGAEMIGREVLALGLPAAGLPFDRGHCIQHVELPGVWLERGRIDAQDATLLESPLGLAGRRVLATQWFAAGRAIEPARRQALLDAARTAWPDSDAAIVHGCSSAHAQVVVLRALANRVEPATALLNRVWRIWRQLAWELAPCAPRVWST